MQSKIILSNYDISDICDYLKIPLIKIISKNELNGTPKNGGYIVNLQSSNAGDGTHWVCFYVRGDIAVYFDSFGEVPPIEVINFLTNKNIYYNDLHIQDFNDDSCGFYCVAFLHYMDNHKGNLKVLSKKFTDFFDPIIQTNNVKILQKYFKWAV